MRGMLIILSLGVAVLAWCLLVLPAWHRSDRGKSPLLRTRAALDDLDRRNTRHEAWNAYRALTTQDQTWYEAHVKLATATELPEMEKVRHAASVREEEVRDLPKDVPAHWPAQQALLDSIKASHHS